MATWTDITDAAVAAGASITTALMTALRDNADAISEGDDTAPRIAMKALERFTIIKGNMSGTTDTTMVDETALDDVGLMRFDYAADQNSDTSPSNVEFRFSDDNGSSWSAWTNIGQSVVSDRFTTCSGYIDLVTGTVQGHSTGGANALMSTTSIDLTILADTNAIQVRVDVGSGATVVSSIIMAPLAGRAVLV